MYSHYQLKKKHKRLLKGMKATAAIKDSVEDFNWLREIEKEEEKFSSTHVIVLGAGMAGLSCAYELQKQGVRVTLLEAESSHIGGRLRTHRKGNSYEEIGGMRFPEIHELTYKYINEFRLETRKFIMDQDEAFMIIRDKVFKNIEVHENESLAMDLFNMSQKERELGYGGLWELGITDVWKGLSPELQKEYFSDQLTSKKLIDLDYEALATAFNNVSISGEPLTKEAREYVITRMGLEGNLSISASEFLREERDDVWGSEFREIVGGADLLPKAIADALPLGMIRPNSKVTKLYHKDGKPTVNYVENKVSTTLSGDWIICTLPLGVLSRLDVADAFSPQKIKAIQGTHYDPATKILGYAPYRWWEKNDGIYGGGSSSDRIIGSTWYPSDNTAKNPRITESPSLFLASYSWGDLARKVSAIPASELNNYIRFELGKAHPYLLRDSSLLKAELRWSWDSYPYAAGAYAFFSPGEQFRFFKAMVEPERNIFLTGEHASHSHSWVQGSLESAVRTTKHILEKIKSNAS